MRRIIGLVAINASRPFTIPMKVYPLHLLYECLQRRHRIPAVPLTASMLQGIRECKAVREDFQRSQTFPAVKDA